MRLKITSGQLGGQFIDTVTTLRPTSELVRKALFDTLGPTTAGSRFGDFYAGSGAVGIEAISRGADTTVFVESNKKHSRLILSNIDKLDITPQTQVVALPVDSFLSKNKQPFDIIFADPWYDTVISPTLWSSSLTPNGILILEHETKIEAPTLTGLSIFNTKIYGDTTLTFYTRTA